ncbi:hypothetical protein HYW82_03630 [Candidatus Peregrinibacteria bacterium]|nr:hypothetical protein [Candidatus Peregrinibacteria bacterium]
MKTIREQDPNRASGLDYAVSTTAQITAQQALNALADGGKTVGGKEIVDPEQASQNLNRALAMVKAKIGDDVEIDLGDIYFQVFDGNVVGESKEDGTFVDPIMLMHPVMRLVHVLAHELAHRKNEIQNEALVEAFVESVFGRSDLEHDYEDGTAMFREFAEKFDKNGDANAGARKIYGLCGRKSRVFWDKRGRIQVLSSIAADIITSFDWLRVTRYGGLVQP